MRPPRQRHRRTPVQAPTDYNPDWRTTGPAAQVLALPPREAPAQPVLQVNRQPLQDLKALIEKYGHTGVQRQLNVHRTTVKRWLARQVQIPGHQLQAIRMLLGDLPGTEGAWPGWHFFKGELVAPNGQAFKAGDVMAIGLNRQRIKALEAEVHKLQVRLAISEEAERRHTGAANEDLRVRA